MIYKPGHIVLCKCLWCIKDNPKGNTIELIQKANSNKLKGYWITKSKNHAHQSDVAYVSELHFTIKWFRTFINYLAGYLK